MKLSKQEYIKRYIWFILGLYILSMGIALSTKANLGVSPVSSIPYVLSLALPFSLGKITIVVQLIYIGCEIAILRKRFNPINFLQILIVVIYGYFNDFSLFLVSRVEPANYAAQWALCIVSMFIIAFGVNMEVKAGVMMLAVDGLMVTISQEFHIDFGKVKIAFDSSQVAIAVVCSFLCMHGLKGVREGTIAAAIFVGMIIKLYNSKLAGFYQAIGLTPIAKTNAASSEESAASTLLPHIITISREVGSGGYEIGKRVSERMNIPLYNKDMLFLAAEGLGESPAEIEQKEQHMIYRFFQQLNNEAYAPVLDPEPVNSFTSKQDAFVNEIASKESCVIVGRLSSYFLRNRPNCFHVFIYAPVEIRVAHIAAANHITLEEARTEVEKRDLERKRHHKFYTGTEYGDVHHHHLALDSSCTDFDQCAEIIQLAAEKYFAAHN